MTDEDLERRVRKVAIDHAETRWLTLQLDDDVKEVAARLQDLDAKVDAVGSTLTGHNARFDSLEADLRSLTQMVGQVLKRLDTPGTVGE